MVQQPGGRPRGLRVFGTLVDTAQQNRAATAVIAVTLTLIAARFVVSAWTDQGIFYPDEIFQSLEAGHRLAFGYGYSTWEFREGMRSWLLPGLMGGVFKVAALFGADSGLALARSAKIVCALITVGTAGLAMLTATRRASFGAGVLAASLVATFPPFAIFGARAMSETISAPFLMGAVLASMMPLADSRRRWLLGGAAAGLAIVFRYQNGFFVAALGLVLAARCVIERPRQFRPFALFVGGATVVFVMGGILDWITWGSPFHSLVAYVKQNLFENRSAHWGVHPFGFYVERLAIITGPSGYVLLALFVVGARFLPGAALACIAAALAHSAIPHKEVRFLAPIFPAAMVVVAVGFDRLVSLALGRRLPRFVPYVAVAAGCLVAPYFSKRANELTHGEFGTPFHHPPQRVLHTDEMQNYALSYVGRMSDSCGVVVASTDLWNTGGYTYLHKNIPLLPPAMRARTDVANYVLARGAFAAPGYAEVKRYAEWAVYRRPDPCRPMPEFSANLN